MSGLLRLLERRDRVGPTATPAASAPWLETLLGGPSAASGVQVTPRNAVNVAALFAGLRLLAWSLAQLPLPVLRRKAGKSVEARSHPLWNLLNESPNGLQTAFEFRELQIGYALLYGNSVAWQETTAGGSVKALWLLNPERVKFWVTPDERRLVYEYRPRTGESRYFAQDEVLHLRGPLGNLYVGYSLADLAREALGIALTAEEHAARFFANGATPSGVLTHPKKLSDETFKKLQRQWDNRYAGAGNAHKTVVLEEGLDYKPLALALKELQFLELRQFQVTEIARWLGIPPHTIGDLERSTNNNIEHQGMELVRHALGPWAVRIEQRLKMSCLGSVERESYYFKHRMEAFLRGNTLDRFRAYTLGRNGGWLSVNDIRGFEDQEPVDGGDVYLSPLNMVPSTMVEDILAGGSAPPPALNPSQGSGGGDPTTRSRPVGEPFIPLALDIAERCVRRAAHEVRRLARRDGPQAADVSAHEAFCARALSPLVHGVALQVAGHVGARIDLSAAVDFATRSAAAQWSAAMMPTGRPLDAVPEDAVWLRTAPDLAGRVLESLTTHFTAWAAAQPPTEEAPTP
jgi:HK97 family phage portal protein